MLAGLERALSAVVIAFALSITSAPHAVWENGHSSVAELADNVPAGWTEVSQALKPPAMAGTMMAYSSKDQRFVLFGGWNGMRGLNETWAFDPGNRTWTQLHPPVSPSERGDEMFVYDEQADVFVLFGGWYEFPNETYSRLSDTWTFSLSTGTWTERQPARSPSPRSDAEVAYNSAVAATLLVGGFDGSGYLGDVWAYSFANDTWTERTSSVQPSPRSDGRMVYVPTQNRFILYGGNDYHGPNFTFHHLSDTWSYDWNSNVWTALSTAIAPSARDYPVLDVDQKNQMILLTSGYGDRTMLNDLWGFDLTHDTWFNLTPILSPPPRFAAAGGFDPENHVLVLFGGLGTGGLLADTWYYRYTPATASIDGLGSVLNLGLGAVSVVVVVGLVIGVRLSRRRRRGRSAEEDRPSKPGAGGAA